jgi:hypothetical protein
MWVLNLKLIFKFSSRARLHKKFATETRPNDQASCNILLIIF